MGTDSVVIGVDLGGTNIHAGVVAGNGSLREFVVRPYEQGSAAKVLEALSESILALKDRYPQVRKVGVVAAGQVDRRTGSILKPVNIAGVDRLPLVEALEESTGLSVVCDNDAVGAALAEGWVGKAKDAQTFITVTMGTGIGTGVIIDRRVFRGGLDLGCEWGHVAMGRDSLYRCGCGNPGCIETWCSASALVYEARAKGMVVDSAMEVCRRAENDDPLAGEVMEEFAQRVALALYSYTIILNPEIIVIGGGLSASAYLFLPKARELLIEKLRSRPYMMPPGGVVCSSFPGDAGVLGAAYLCSEGGRIRF
ncbi:MAG TPA: ROK family protein [Deltaproteobacteria bacterium]|nr:ROK family protein [Deltaproteobacteria bacterium]